MDIVPIVLQMILVAFLIAMNGFFVAAEFCCVKMRPSRLETLIQEGNTRAKYAKKLIDELDEALSVTQLGITLASLGLGWVGEPFVAELIAPLIHAVGVGETLGHTISFALAFTLITAMHIILGELTPKSMAIAASEKILLNIALPMIIFWKVMYPFVWLLNTTATFVSKHLGLTSSEGEVAHNPEEIRLLMKESRKQGLVDDTEVDFVDNVFDFTERNVREIMVPRLDMVCLYLDKSYEENLVTILDEEMTRYPLCDEDKDHIVGFLHIKDLTKVLIQGKRRPSLRKLARKVFFVPESMDVSVLLDMMQKNRSRSWRLSSTNTAGLPAWSRLKTLLRKLLATFKTNSTRSDPTPKSAPITFIPSTRRCCLRSLKTNSTLRLTMRTLTRSAAGSTTKLAVNLKSDNRRHSRAILFTSRRSKA